MPQIKLEGLSRYYRTGAETIKALHNISLTIESGEFVAIVGPSGSGKSTLMNIIGCMDRSTAGEYQINGDAVDALSSDRLAQIRNSTIGFVFQSFHLLSRLTALRNTELPLIYSGTPKRERQKRASEALEKVGLKGRSHHLPTQLSGGQQQRVAIARAMVTQPKLLLADEPTGALDTHTGEEIMSLLRELNKGGVTVILITHEAEVAAYARRRLEFRDGQLITDSALSSQQ
ncbi:MAG: macrolide ABC transporter ATP-binding protein [Acidiferrobacteraceae bacterium]|jgi:putative ABC transport system ATP-binding protein|nr:macrolide ABC transporter ATP-binding protein [Acidiferrobacteraceae bacterium]MDP6122997.1 ABC transporter ATP-binding protein [Arenicellales bacterium]MDP6433993.1 ABC transporter ATP-binding protein [Arenicellales bacterium]MDP6671968.1 ABC transporter ATP-binding protein [Arenicellales bacterium]MDP6723869.1 ABC transporter ATP-binding protein [Arenicellales bacterium]|tara:strand:+ start:1564 stop:2256 length:693 start_codon:yes stop_codon:yes gene_type:complete